MKKLILLFLFPAFLHAEPGPATQYLMNEPASLFDVSMLRLEQLIAYWEKQMTFNYRLKSGSDPVASNVNALYRPEDDRFYVILHAMDESATGEQMEAGCRYALRHIQIYVNKHLHVLFRHAGYRDPSEPPDLLSAMSDRFDLRCYVSTHDSSVGRFWASQGLRTEDMTVGQWELFN